MSDGPLPHRRRGKGLVSKRQRTEIRIKSDNKTMKDNGIHELVRIEVEWEKRVTFRKT